jgi:arginase family enzyme
MDLVELNPIFDVRNTSGEIGVELALSAFGKRIL